MKKAVLVALLAGTTFLSAAPVFAAAHHHGECKKVRVHHHWERHCK